MPFTLVGKAANDADWPAKAGAEATEPSVRHTPGPRCWGDARRMAQAAGSLARRSVDLFERIANFDALLAD